MKLSQGIFTIKLYELEQEYAEMLSKLRTCQQEEHPKLLRDLEDSKDDYRKKELALQDKIKHCRSEAVSALADAQKNYMQQTEYVLNQKLPQYLHSPQDNSLETRAEATSLYAEYAVDFAVQAMRHALIAAMTAIDLQMSCEEKENSEDRKEPSL